MHNRLRGVFFAPYCRRQRAGFFAEGGHSNVGGQTRTLHRCYIEPERITRVVGTANMEWGVALMAGCNSLLSPLTDLACQLCPRGVDHGSDALNLLKFLGQLWGLDQHEEGDSETMLQLQLLH